MFLFGSLHKNLIWKFQKKEKRKKKKLGVLQKDKSEVRVVGYIEAVIGDSCWSSASCEKAMEIISARRRIINSEIEDGWREYGGQLWLGFWVGSHASCHSLAWSFLGARVLYGIRCRSSAWEACHPIAVDRLQGNVTSWLLSIALWRKCFGW